MVKANDLKNKYDMFDREHKHVYNYKREQIRKILYQNSHDDSECLRIKFEDIHKVITLLENL